MGFQAISRGSDSPNVAAVMGGFTEGSGRVIRPAECHWHMVLVDHPRFLRLVITGPHTAAGDLPFEDGVGLLWIKFRLGVFLPHLPGPSLADRQLALPPAGPQSVWLDRTRRQLPTFENADTFVDHLVRDGVLAFDPLIEDLLQGRPTDLAPRTVRHRFRQATGLSPNAIFQIRRAQQAADLLRRGTPIQDVVAAADYYDQAHLTRATRRWVGLTPAALRGG